MTKDLDYWLDEISVDYPGMQDDDTPKWLDGWFAVSHPDKGVVAYFFDEHAALSHRLHLIALELNVLEAH